MTIRVIKSFLVFLLALTIFGFLVPLLDRVFPSELLAKHLWVKPTCLYSVAIVFGVLQFFLDLRKYRKAQQGAAANP
jgi:hypothetical protein